MYKTITAGLLVISLKITILKYYTRHAWAVGPCAPGYFGWHIGMCACVSVCLWSFHKGINNQWYDMV